MQRLIPIGVLLTALITSPVAFAQPAIPDGVICPMDAMECPDGTMVGRSGPNCEFVCPTTPNSSTTPETSFETRPRAEVLKSNITDGALERQAQRESAEEAREELRAERHGTLSEIRQQRIINLAANISNRMDAAVDRLYAIVARLESRITKIAASGIDTSEATRNLQQAAASLATAKSLLSTIDERVSEATFSEEPLAKWSELRQYYQDIGQEVRAAHTALRATVAALKAALATTTPGVSEAVRNDTSTGTETTPTATP